MFENQNTKFSLYQDSWKEKFESEKKKIISCLEHYKSEIQVEHIGSTSIEGLNAKPIIDIAVLIDSIEDTDQIVFLLTPLHYTYFKDMSSRERIFLRKGNPIEYHLSLTSPHYSFWKRNILFRDYLRKHKEFKIEYQNLKESNLKITPKQDFEDLSKSEKYNAGKDAFVKKVLKLAEAEIATFE